MLVYTKFTQQSATILFNFHRQANLAQNSLMVLRIYLFMHVFIYLINQTKYPKLSDTSQRLY